MKAKEEILDLIDRFDINSPEIQEFKKNINDDPELKEFLVSLRSKNKKSLKEILEELKVLVSEDSSLSIKEKESGVSDALDKIQSAIDWFEPKQKL